MNDQLMEDLQRIFDASFGALLNAGDETLFRTVIGYCADVICKMPGNAARLQAADDVLVEIKRVIEEHQAAFGDGETPP